MDSIVIQGVPPYDGRWDFDLEQRELTTREWGWIKRLAGYLPLELEEKQFGDPELMIVFAAIALRRAGKVEAQDVPRVFEQLSDAPFGSAITLEAGGDQPEGDAGPPPSSSSVNGVSSGTGSPASSGTSAPTPNPSGTPGSVTSPSVPLRSGS